MKKYTGPVIMTIAGYIEIEAISLDSAKETFKLMNVNGVDENMIQDQSINSELMVEEIEETEK